MTYSTLENSIWSTQWSSTNCKSMFKIPTKKLKRCQRFIVDYGKKYSISYGEIMDKGIPVVLEKVKNFYSDPNIQKHQLKELGDYLKIFVYDVNDHFKWSTFFKLEWYYPIKYTILKSYGLIGKKIK